VLQTAQRQGIGALLIGQCGNATVSWTGAPHLTSLRRMRQEKGWKAAVKMILPLFTLRFLRQHRLKRTDWKHSAIHASFALSTKLIARQISSIGKNPSVPESITTPRELRYALIEPNNALLGAGWSEIGADFGMEVRDPTMDKRVLTFTISIPDHFFVGPDKQDRWLIRTAMAGLLPPKVCFNTQIGSQAADIGHRLIHSGDDLEQLFAKINGSEAINYIDLAKLKDVWAQLHKGITLQNTQQTVSVLLRGLNAGMFFIKNG